MKILDVSSIRCWSHQTKVYKRTFLKLNITIHHFAQLFKDLDGFPYRKQVWQWLTEQDRHLRIEYCAQFLAMVYGDPDFLLNMWFSDESHIHLDGFINRQTMHFLCFWRPDVIVQKPLHSEHVMIWCAVSGNGVLGPYFIEDDDCIPLTVTQEHYRNMVVRPFIQDLRRFCCARNIQMNTQWF